MNRTVPTKASTRGVAALEFALSLPIWMALLIGSTDTAFLLLQAERVDRITYTVTDIITQSETLSTSDLDKTFLAASQLMKPYDFTSKGVIIVSSVFQSPGQLPKITWQYTSGSAISRDSQVGTSGGTPSMPNGLVLNDNDNVIIVEVYYAYTPLFVNAGFLHARDLYHAAVYKPRLSPLMTPPRQG